MRPRWLHRAVLVVAALGLAGCGGGGGGGGSALQPVGPDTVVLLGTVAPPAAKAAAVKVAALPDPVRVSLLSETGEVAATELLTAADPSFALEVPAGHDYVMVFRDAAPGGRTLGVLEADTASGRTLFALPAGAADVNLGAVTLDSRKGRATCGAGLALAAPRLPPADDDGDGIPNFADTSADEDGDGVADADDTAPFDETVLAQGILSAGAIPKFVEPVILIPEMPKSAAPAGTPEGTDYYELAVRQFEQQVLPPTLPKTPVWGFGSSNHPETFHYPGLTIEATYGRPVRVKWINDLKDATGKALPHLLPVDPTIHWANPIGARDMAPPLDPTHPYWQHPYIDPATGRYVGPVPFVPHLHGIEVSQESDGYAEAWFLPAGSTGVNYKAGTLYDHFKASSALGALWEEGSAVYEYPNGQRPATLWFHDHAIGLTRLNVYAGLGGFYLLRGGVEDQVGDSAAPQAAGALPGPAPSRAAAGPYREIPLAVQDRTFKADGSLFYPTGRAFFEGVAPADLQIPMRPDKALDGFASDVAPIWNPEFFGNTIVVNGRTWPYLEVENVRYRLRFLNGCGSRFLILKFSDPAVKVWHLGADGGFLPQPEPEEEVLLGPAERADVLVDFGAVTPGTTVTLLNLGPDEPYGGGTPDVDFAAADPATTGLVMEFRVGAATADDASTPPDRLVLPAREPLPEATHTRYLSLNEEMSGSVCVQGDAEGNFLVPIQAVACGTAGTGWQAVEFGPAAAKLGTYDPATGEVHVDGFESAITEKPAVGTTEVWEIWNFTEDAHPIHLHLVQFEVLGRAVQADPAATSVAGSNEPLPSERGTKDTVIAYPGEITRVKATFTRPGLYMWHCHILEHEDNEMMRPYCVTDPQGNPDPACLVADEVH